MSIRVSDSAGVGGRVTVRVWDVEELEANYPRWSRRPRFLRHRLLSNPDYWPVDPIREGTTRNLATDGYLEALAAGADPEPSHLALGDGTTAPAGTNTQLNNEVYRTLVGQDEPDGKDRLTSTMVSQNEANGLAIREIGFTDGPTGGSWTLLTHTVLDAADQIDQKTSDITVTIQYVLEYRRI